MAPSYHKQDIFERILSSAVKGFEKLAKAFMLYRQRVNGIETGT